MFWTIIAWIVFGALAGWIASLIVGTNRQQGAVMNVVVGIVGAIIGGALTRIFGASGVTGFNIYSLIVAIIGAVILLMIVRAVRGGTASGHRA